MHRIPQNRITFHSRILFANRELYACCDTMNFRDHEISLC
jgi:hypothetical protein